MHDPEPERSDHGDKAQLGETGDERETVTKQSANDYRTSLTGLKFKIAHKRAGSEKWNATPRTQRKRMITFLQSVIADLHKQSDSLEDVMSTRQKPASEGREVRARRPSSAKRATFVRRRAKPASAPRRDRAARVGRPHRSRA